MGSSTGSCPSSAGSSPSTLEGPRDIETHVADKVAVLDPLGWGRAWLVGHSWGGHLALHIAVAHPERVTGLILFETLGAIPDGGSEELVANLVARLPRGASEARRPRGAQQTDDDDPTLMGQLYMTLWPSYWFIHEGRATRRSASRSHSPMSRRR